MSERQQFFAKFCSARLQAGILVSIVCPPEGGRYMKMRYRTALSHLNSKHG